MKGLVKLRYGTVTFLLLILGLGTSKYDWNKAEFNDGFACEEVLKKQNYKTLNLELLHNTDDSNEHTNSWICEQYQVCNKKVLALVGDDGFDHIKLYTFSSEEQKYYLFSVRRHVASGLGINYTSWVLLKEIDQAFFAYESVATDNPFVYLKDDSIHYFEIEFSEEFFRERDYNNVFYDIKLFKYNWSKNKPELVKEWSDRCK